MHHGGNEEWFGRRFLSCARQDMLLISLNFLTRLGRKKNVVF